MLKQEFSTGDIVTKVHYDCYSKEHRFVKMKVCGISYDYETNTLYRLESIEKSFAWICVTTANFLIESKCFAIFKSPLIHKEYQQLLESMKKGIVTC